MTDVSAAADAPKPATARRSVWRIIPGALGACGALVGLAAFFMPWYTTAGGATYTGISLITTSTIPYQVPSTSPQGGDCYGALSGYNVPVSLLAGVLLATLVGSVAMRWLLSRRRAAFALALSLLAASWVGESFPFSWASVTLSTTPVAGEPWPCGPAGSQDSAFTVLQVSLYVIIVAYIWLTFLTPPAAPWVGVIAATIGIGGFLLPWDLSGTPGVARIVSAINCLNSAGWDTSRCAPSANFPPGTPLAVSEGALTQRAVVDHLALYLFQSLMLLVVLALALVAARWRTRRWLEALFVVSIFVAVMGNPNYIVKESSQLGATAPLGTSLVGLGIGMLFLCSYAAKWEAIDAALRRVGGQTIGEARREVWRSVMGRGPGGDERT